MYSSTTSFNIDYQSCLLDNFSVCSQLYWTWHSFLTTFSKSNIPELCYCFFSLFLDIFKKLVSGICLGKSVYSISGLSFFGCKTETSFLNGLFRFKSSQTSWFTRATYQKLWVFKLPDAVRDERGRHKSQIKEDEASLFLVLKEKIRILHWVGRLLLKVMNMTCLSSASAFCFSQMRGWSGRAGVRKDAVCETAGRGPVFFFPVHSWPGLIVFSHSFLWDWWNQPWLLVSL